METYEEEILVWREKVEASLRRENSWLALAGLFWLSEGANGVGSDPSNKVRLPEGKAPPRLGTFELRDEKVNLYVSAGSNVQMNGELVQEAELQPDTDAYPSTISTGDLSMVVLRRGERFGIRLWDNSRPERQAFPQRKWYPVREDYRVRARFVPSVSPTILALTDATGSVQEMVVAGMVHFNLDGRDFRLEALEVSPGEALFLIFKDRTNGQGTYPAGRYIYTSPPEDGEVIVDFNKAYNPPCAFTNYATCPLPPPQNCLPVRVEAGERYEVG